MSILDGFIDGMRLPPDHTIAEWADSCVVLSSELAAEPGPFRTARTPYAREMMDAPLDPEVETVVFHTSAQIAKTTSMLNILGYHVAHDPCPMIFVVPNMIMDTFSKAKLTPYLSGTPILAERCGLEQSSARTISGTMYRREFPGGFINIAGASSAPALAMQSVRIVLADEVDRFPDRAGKEADPLALAWKRAQTFSNRKLIVSSTPTHKGHSKVDSLFQASDQRHYHIPMPCCGTHHKLVWEQVRWREGEPHTAEYQCETCGVLTGDAELKLAINSPDARWVAEFPERTRNRGYHIWQIYSPWSSMEEIVRKYEEAGKDDQKLEVWTNTVLGESYDVAENIRTTPEVVFASRVELKPGLIPKGACVMTAGVDVQRDRLEVLYSAFGPRKQMWLVRHQVIEGDTSADAVWDRLEQLLMVRWPQEGVPDLIRPLEGVAIDSGYLSQRVYDFASKAFRMGRPWYAVKGQPGEGRIAWEVSKFRSRLLGGAKLHNIGVDALKTEIAARLSSDDARENFIYVAKSDEFSLERIEQIFAEKVLLKINTRGFTTREWVKIPGKRNELLDLMVYSDAVHRSLAINHELRMASATQRRTPTGPQLAALFNGNPA